MKILILTQYFPPETGAPQNRLHSLARHIKGLGENVTVLTTMPNYPKMVIQDGYKGRFFVKESEDGLDIFRSWIFVSVNRSILFRLINYFSFVFSSLFTAVFRISKHDILICESPPLFLGITAMIIAKVKGSKLVFNVSDLWPESAEKLGLVSNRFFLDISYWLEKIIYKSSDLVSCQTNGILNNIKERYPDTPLVWLPNGIDMVTFNLEANGEKFRKANDYHESDFVLLYAGIIGHAQGLEVIVKSAEHTKHLPYIKYLIVGDGPELAYLKNMAAENRLDNVKFHPNVPRQVMPDIVSACNAYIVPLRKNDLFLGAIPSKVFEPLAIGKPILLGVDGEARSLFITKGNGGIYFEPENDLELSKAIIELYNNPSLAQELGRSGQSYVRENFDRKKIAESFHTKLKEL